MFTGLVECKATVDSLRNERHGVRLAIRPQPKLADAGTVAIGDSISISGCCLTVVAIEDGCWEFEAGEETLAKTQLGGLASGSQVNIERSLAVGARLGGHFVQGHVDGTGTVDDIQRSADWIDMWFRADPALTALMVPKGSITVDGVSLTLVNVTSDRFSVALIPHTLEVTTLGQRQVGDSVNIETDILGKYIRKLMRGEDAERWRPDTNGDSTGSPGQNSSA